MEKLVLASPGTTNRHAEIRLERGNLLATADADIMVVSAFAGNYAKTRSSLIGQLSCHDPAIDVGELAKAPEIDLRGIGRTWLSGPLPPDAPAARLLCFESPTRAQRAKGETALSIIGDLFRGLNTALATLPDKPGRKAGAEVVMPVVATGNQGYKVRTIMPGLLEAATGWIGKGIPLERLTIMVHDDPASDEDWLAARRAFCSFRAAYYRTSPPTAPAPTHDIFLSYSRRDMVEALRIEAGLKEVIRDVRIWRDEKEIERGSTWRPKCFGDIDKCRMMLCVISSCFIESAACIDEFNTGWARQKALGRAFLYPLPIYSCEMPTYIAGFDRKNCAEFDSTKLDQAYAEVKALLGRFRAEATPPA